MNVILLYQLYILITLFHFPSGRGRINNIENSPVVVFIIIIVIVCNLKVSQRWKLKAKLERNSFSSIHTFIIILLHLWDEKTKYWTLFILFIFFSTKGMQLMITTLVWGYTSNGFVFLHIHLRPIRFYNQLFYTEEKKILQLVIKLKGITKYLKTKLRKSFWKLTHWFKVLSLRTMQNLQKKKTYGRFVAGGGTRLELMIEITYGLNMPKNSPFDI